MAFDLYAALATWQNMGIFDFVLPFLLVFTLSYAVLSKSGILGANKNLNTIVSLVLAFFFLQNPFLIASLQNILPNVSFVLILGLMFLLILGVLFGDKMGEHYSRISLKWATWASIGAILWAIFAQPNGSSFTNFQDMIYGFLGPDLSGLLPLALVIAAAFFLVRSGDKPDDSPSGKPPKPGG